MRKTSNVKNAIWHLPAIRYDTITYKKCMMGLNSDVTCVGRILRTKRDFEDTLKTSMMVQHLLMQGEGYIIATLVLVKILAKVFKILLFNPIGHGYWLK